MKINDRAPKRRDAVVRVLADRRYHQRIKLSAKLYSRKGRNRKEGDE